MFEVSHRLHGARLSGWLLRLPLKLLPSGLMMPTLSGINRGMKWKVGASTHGCWLGFYEKDKQELIARLVQPGMRAFDIGANAGFYTLALSQLVGEHGRVWAFEPFAENVVNVLKHVRINDCNNVAVIQGAVSDAMGLAGFDIGESNSIGALGGNRKYLVPTMTLDGLLVTGQAEAPDIVKMDVEGAESMVLAGATDLLQLRKTIWVVALHGDDQRKAVIGTFRAHGYRVFSLDGIKVGEDFVGDEIWAAPAEYEAER